MNTMMDKIHCLQREDFPMCWKIDTSLQEKSRYVIDSIVYDFSQIAKEEDDIFGFIIIDNTHIPSYIMHDIEDQIDGVKINGVPSYHICSLYDKDDKGLLMILFYEVVRRLPDDSYLWIDSPNEKQRDYISMLGEFCNPYGNLFILLNP